MTICRRCRQQVDGATNYCPNCGEDLRDNKIVPEKNNAPFLIALCVLTIIGSVFTIGRAYLYEMVSMIDGESNYIRGWIYGGSSVGTLIGALKMIQRKLQGLYIYSIFQVIYIVTVIVASLSYSDTFGSLDQSGHTASLLASGIAMFFLLPSVLFLILYWTKMIRKYLS